MKQAIGKRWLIDQGNVMAAVVERGRASGRSEVLKPSLAQVPDDWDLGACEAIIAELWVLRGSMLAHEQVLQPLLERAAPSYRESARNLAHYLALRHSDRRPLQKKLAWIGVSDLGRAESHVLANLDKVLGILHRLTGLAWQSHAAEEPVGIRRSQRLIEEHATRLLGSQPAERAVRIMVTLPSEAAKDFGLVRALVNSGMDIARINCAHDDADAWKQLAGSVRRAAKAAGRSVRILMDLGGPKLRTGDFAPGRAVIKMRPQRDELGRTTAPYRLGLRPPGSSDSVRGARIHLGIAGDLLAGLREGDSVDFTDARGAKRSLKVVRIDG